MNRSYKWKSSLAVILSVASMATVAADRALLDILLANGVISEAQHAQLIEKESVSASEVLSSIAVDQPDESAEVATGKDVKETADAIVLDRNLRRAIDVAVANAVSSESPIEASYGSKGFRFETRDGNWQTNLQWRAQLRYSNPYGSDPRQMANYEDSSGSSFEQRRLRMKIGGHGFKPWIKYYFEVDLQPARDVDADAVSSGARVIDWRIDLAKWDWGGIRMGQWKVDLNRERVDSSGRQQFVERSIVNRIFTMDRQVGIQLRGRLFEGTMADMRYYAGVFNGEGRGVKNNSTDHLYMGRLQWNFPRPRPQLAANGCGIHREANGLLRQLPASPIPAPALAGPLPAAVIWMGSEKPADATEDQFKIEQAVQEFAFKYRGFSIQQEWHRKFVTDRSLNTESDMTGFYLQSGYFFHNLFDAFPAPLELAARYAYVSEPNKSDRGRSTTRERSIRWGRIGSSRGITIK